MVCGGDYDDFKMAKTPHKNKSLNFLNGDVLVGAFQRLYNGERVDVALKDCYYREYDFPFELKPIEKLRLEGIYSNALWSYMPYSLKVTDNPSLTYDTCQYYSPSSQIWYPNPDEPDYEDEFNQESYNEVWNHYFGNIE